MINKKQVLYSSDKTCFLFFLLSVIHRNDNLYICDKYDIYKFCINNSIIICDNL